MFLADVLGTVVAPVQHAVLEAQRLLLVRPLTPRGRASGPMRIAIDRAQAGPGDRVLVIDEGNAARTVLAAPDAPVKTVIVGVVDYVDLAGELVFDARRRKAVEPLD